MAEGSKEEKSIDILKGIRTELQEIHRVLDSYQGDVGKAVTSLETFQKGVEDGIKALDQRLLSLDTTLRNSMAWMKENPPQPPQAKAPPKARAPAGSTDLEGIPNSELLEAATQFDETRIRPKRFLGDRWKETNNALRSRGFRWVAAGKESYWTNRPEEEG